MIEHEMEERFQDMLAKNEAKLRSMPVSLTQEVQTAQSIKNELEAGAKEVSGYAKTRELILERLGGPFDYSQYNEDL